MFTRAVLGILIFRGIFWGSLDSITLVFLGSLWVLVELAQLTLKRARELWFLWHDNRAERALAYLVLAPTWLVVWAFNVHPIQSGLILALGILVIEMSVRHKPEWAIRSVVWTQALFVILGLAVSYNNGPWVAANLAIAAGITLAIFLIRVYNVLPRLFARRQRLKI